MTFFETAPDKSRWSGFVHGMRLGLPVAPGIMAFGLVVGAAAARQGLTFLQNLAMNFFVCSGIAQLVALEIWPAVMTWAAVLTVAVLAGVVGARLFLMSVAMRPWLGERPAWQAYTALFFLTDATWLIAMRYRADGGRDVAAYFGAAAAIMAAWLAATGVGYFVGSFIADPTKYGLDLVMPAFFAAMLVPLWVGPRRAWGWLVAGIVAVAVERLIPGWWFIVAGSIVGAVAGGYLDEQTE
ncbi:MAG: AzlC family ABC transporter permease [Pseudolabrys sp.]